MYKFIPVVLLISFLLQPCDGKISLPPGGNTIISPKGSQVNISWSFDDPMYRVIYRFWSFHRYGDETKDLAFIHADETPLILNSSLPGIEVVKPATLVLKNVDLRYNGTYQFVVGGVASGSSSYVNLFVVGLDEDRISTGILKKSYFPTICKNSVTAFSGNITINTMINGERTVKVWHVIVALLFGVFIGAIFSYLMMCFRRRFRRKKRQSKLQHQKTQATSVYEELDLNKMNNEEGHNQRKINSAENENVPTYAELSQTRDAENIYQSLT